MRSIQNFENIDIAVILLGTGTHFLYVLLLLFDPLTFSVV